MISQAVSSNDCVSPKRSLISLATRTGFAQEEQEEHMSQRMKTVVNSAETMKSGRPRNKVNISPGPSACPSRKTPKPAMNVMMRLDMVKP